MESENEIRNKTTSFQTRNVQYALSETTDDADVSWLQIQKKGSGKMCRFNTFVDANTNEWIIELEFMDMRESEV